MNDLGEPSLKNLTKGDNIKTVSVNFKKKIDIKNEEEKKERKKKKEKRNLSKKRKRHTKTTH